MATVGSGDYVYEPVVDWAKLPAGWSFKEIGSVGVDKNDNVYVFNRGEHPMIVFDRDGNFLRSWGEGVFNRAHGLDLFSRELVAKLRPIRRPIAAKDLAERHHGMPAVSCSKASVACCSTLCVRWV